MAGPHQLFCIKLPSFSHLNLSSLVNYSDPTPSSTPLQLRTSNLASSKPASWVEKSKVQLNLQLSVEFMACVFRATSSPWLH